MFIDSHCHINFPGLAERMPDLLQAMAHNQVTHALCVSVELAAFPQILDLAEQHPNILASVGVHPDHEDCGEPDVEQLLSAGAACMNLLHAAHAMGFGANWLTGWAAFDPSSKELFGLADLHCECGESVGQFQRNCC